MSYAKAYGLSIEHVRPLMVLCIRLPEKILLFLVRLQKRLKNVLSGLYTMLLLGDITAKVADYTGIQVAQELSFGKNV